MNTNPAAHRDMATAIRALAMDAVQQADSGHPGMPMGMADVATILFTRFMKFDPTDPRWPDRDRFILSAGHGSMLLYSLLYLTGYADMTIDQLKSFRQLGSKTAGHPEYGHAAGIETTTGPLGQGLANSVGMLRAVSKNRTGIPQNDRSDRRPPRHGECHPGSRHGRRAAGGLGSPRHADGHG